MGSLWVSFCFSAINLFVSEAAFLFLIESPAGSKSRIKQASFWDIISKINNKITLFTGDQHCHINNLNMLISHDLERREKKDNPEKDSLSYSQQLFLGRGNIN